MSAPTDPANTVPFYSVREVAQRWNVHPETVRRVFADESDGVLRFGRAEDRHKRQRFIIRISAAALHRMELKLQKRS